VLIEYVPVLRIGTVNVFVAGDSQVDVVDNDDREIVLVPILKPAVADVD